MIALDNKEDSYISELGEKLDLKLREIYDELVIVHGYNQTFEAFAYHVAKIYPSQKPVSKIEIIPMMERKFSFENIIMLPKEYDSQLKVSKHNGARRDRFIARQKSKK